MKDRLRSLILTIAYHHKASHLASELRSLKNKELAFKNHELLQERGLPCLCCAGGISVRKEKRGTK